MIPLTRPLVFIDIEATGLRTDTDRIVELVMCKISTDGEDDTRVARFNPGIPIPADVIEIHGITNEDVKDEPTFKQKAKGVLEFITGCDIAGYNSNRYDVPMLYNEFLRAGITWDYSDVNFVDVGNIFKIQEPRDLTAAMKFYCNQAHEDAHSAEADVMATKDVFIAQLIKYPELPQTIAELSIFSNHGNKMLDVSGKFCYDKDGKTILLNFGPHRGKKAIDNTDFLEWMLQRDFPPDTVAIVAEIIKSTQDEDIRW